MPELPEVENIRLGLAYVLEGRRIIRTIQNRTNLRYILPERFSERITGCRVMRLERRAKYILAYLESEEVLLIHLGMSGRFTIQPDRPNPIISGKSYAEINDNKTQIHDHIIFYTEDNVRIVYSDHRRFGFMDLIATNELWTNIHLINLGPEPLGNEFSASIILERLKGRRTAIKTALLDQRIIGGLGNIYACEALFRSSISPNYEAGKIDLIRIEKLVYAIRNILTEAIAAGGSTLRDYANTDGELGRFQHCLAVYDKEGKSCLKQECSGFIKRIVQAGRSTFYCPNCQH